MSHPYIRSICFTLFISLLSFTSTFPAETTGGLDTSEIVQKVKEKYQNLDGYKSTGEVITEMDMSSIDTSKIPGAPKDADSQNSPLFKSMMQQKQVIKHTFEILLSRNGNYRIEWSQNLNQMINIQGVAWSTNGQFKMKISNPMMQEQVMEQNDRTTALGAATGVSGGVANTIPSLFYDLKNEVFSNMLHTKKLPNEKIGETDCYVIEGNLAGQKMTYWIDTDTFLIQQRIQIMGKMDQMPEMSDEDIKTALQSMNQEATPEAIERMRKQIKDVGAMTSTLKGTIVERHQDIQVNPDFQSGDFIPQSDE